jgi:isopentenyldiphosphate isomerase
MSDALIPIVDENDNVLEYRSRDALDRSKDIYRVCSVWITNDNNELLLAQRSFHKKIFPGIWDVAVAGTVEKGETYEEAAKRELLEELEMTDSLEKGPKVLVEEENREYKLFIQWFFLKTNKRAEEFRFQRSEIERIKWFSKQELLEDLGREPGKYIAKDMLRWVRMFWK